MISLENPIINLAKCIHIPASLIPFVFYTKKKKINLETHRQTHTYTRTRMLQDMLCIQIK